MQNTFSLLSMTMREQVLSLCVLLGRARWPLLHLFPAGGWYQVGLFNGLLASLVPAAMAFCSFDRGMYSSKQYVKVLFLDP